MKLCVPTIGNGGLSEKVNDHFGSAPYFTLIDLDSNEVEIISNQNEHHTHGSCHPTQALEGKNVEAVVCNGMGRRAIQILNMEGLKVYIAEGNTVQDVVGAYKNGQLSELTPDQACAGHGCH